MSKVLVTGCAGFIGSHLTQRLLQEGYDVVGIDGFIENYDTSVKLRNLSLIGSHPNFTFHSSPLQAGDWRHWLDGIETVYHLSALTGVRTSWGKIFTDCVQHNLIATQQLLEACLTAPAIKSIVISSSSSVYGTMNEAATEGAAPVRPLSPYGVTKAAMEHLCLVYVHAFGLPVVLLRYFTVYGPRQRPDMAFHRLFRKMMRGDALTIYGDGTQTRDFTYVSDVVEANLLAAQKGGAGEIFNIGGSNEICLLDAVEKMGNIMGVKPKLLFLPEQSGDPRRTCADIAKARGKLGYQPQVSLEQGLRFQLDDLIDFPRG